MLTPFVLSIFLHRCCQQQDAIVGLGNLSFQYGDEAVSSATLNDANTSLLLTASIAYGPALSWHQNLGLPFAAHALSCDPNFIVDFQPDKWVLEILSPFTYEGDTLDLSTNILDLPGASVKAYRNGYGPEVDLEIEGWFFQVANFPLGNHHFRLTGTLINGTSYSTEGLLYLDDQL